MTAPVGDRCVIPWLLRYVDTRSENGYTAVHLAALSGTLACVQTLLESGASMMVRTLCCICSDRSQP